MPGTVTENAASELRRVDAIRYVTALREGGSLPGLVEGDDDGTWVVKFHGAGQGPGALVSEVVAGEIARRIGLPVPELVLVEVAAELGHAEPDPEIQELIEASPGLNLGMDFLPGALPFALSPDEAFDPELAADIVFFDALITNIDRTPRNPNLLTWHGRTWLIDHGAAFYRQHGAAPLAETATAPTPVLRDHVLLPVAGPLTEAGERLGAGIAEAVEPALALVPDEWLGDQPEARREDFRLFLDRRLTQSDVFVAELEGDDE
ncbi:MAG TPA: aminotransferase class I and II [Solirubrobacterales bacterium]|nr:aminotransferase class I and II [Solirubrobacterales bacterium]